MKVRYAKSWIKVSTILLITIILLLFLFSKFIEKRTGEEVGKEAVKLFPFYLPWDDSEETTVSLSRFLDKPAGKYGHVYVGEDGHLYIGGKRIKFIGVNICASAAFPKKEDAKKIAARLAKFGINLVRFHHLEAPWDSFNIFDKKYRDTRHLNKEALDRLDYFISKLKEEGIYVDLNLLVSRRFTTNDGLPPEIETMNWKDQHVLSFFVDKVKELEKEYAKQLLTHRNPYTNMTYAEDPVVAFIEIINEHGLIHSWLGGVIDRVPSVFKKELMQKWNDYLREKYQTTERLYKAWSEGEESPIGKEILENGYFERDTRGWNLEVHDEASAYYNLVKGPENIKGRVLEVIVKKRGKAGWHVQFNYPGLKIRAGENYLVTFWAKADKEATITVCLRQAHSPWSSLSQIVQIKLTAQWKRYEIALMVLKSDNNARLDISNLGLEENTYYFASFSLRPFKGYSLLNGESLEEGTVHIFTLDNYGKRTKKARKDWIEFLWKLEEGYFLDMYNYLKNKLNVKALIIGTIVGCSTPNIMTKLDVIDTHAYWHHPAFPGKPWDPENWYVVNEPMVNKPLESTISRLALKRVYKKPFTVSEYNHPAPNMYDTETAIILATYAALQDWDGIFLFNYGKLDEWNSRCIRGYFDIDQHPTKLASLISAYMLFIRGDVRPADKIVAVELDREEEVELVANLRARAWNLPDGSYVGLQPYTPLIHRTVLVVQGTSKPEEYLTPQDVKKPQSNVFISDNRQIVWNASDPQRGVLIINTSRSIAVLGYISNKTYRFGTITIKPGNTLLNGWGSIAIHVIEGNDFRDWKRLLIIAIGYTTNTGMVIYEYDTKKLLFITTSSLINIHEYLGKITCNRKWGHAPTLTEGIPAQILIQTSTSIKAWALDNIGKRSQPLSVHSRDHYKMINIGPQYRTIWYEISKEGGK